MAVRRLEKEQADIRLLEGPLCGFYRLRVGPYRIVYTRQIEKGTIIIRCLYAERRDLVYTVFSQVLKKTLLKYHS